MNRQLESWKGEFGDAYTERNQIDWRTRVGAFADMLAGLALERILEIGCNRAHNLVAISRSSENSPGLLVGVEPNHLALSLAREIRGNAGLVGSSAFELPFRTSSFDLVFTAGVLIHISPDDLPKALGEIYRTSRRYILTIEYYAEEETGVCYRGRDDLLWKRDFLRAFLDRFPDLSLRRSGYWDRSAGFDRTHWWLLEKSSACGR